jgi:hypothetical protein
MQESFNMSVGLKFQELTHQKLDQTLVSHEPGFSHVWFHCKHVSQFLIVSQDLFSPCYEDGANPKHNSL